MRKGYSIHIGVNEVNYGGYTNKIESCRNDACSMQDIAKRFGFDGEIFGQSNYTLLDNDVVKPITDNFKEAIKEVDNVANDGDILFLTFSGHGDQIFGSNENDKLAETWCFSDREMSDVEISNLFKSLTKKIRILIISDSCHSGSIIDFAQLGITYEKRIILKEYGFIFEALQSEILTVLGYKFTAHKNHKWSDYSRILERVDSQVYEKIEQLIKASPELLINKNIKTIPRELSSFGNHANQKNQTIPTAHSPVNTKQDILLLSACADNEETFGCGNKENSEFTEEIKKILPPSSVSPTQTYQWLHQELLNVFTKPRIGCGGKCREIQTPQLLPHNGTFRKEGIFTI